ncbi:hypothetical protein ACFVX6_20335 [Streptomyces sp. NPDC058289]|uniref:hypothetical protein n=1 Tax=Streptomyces sp. NPDC058289 TaxID=3346425 RepID=UPI0036EB3858
MARAVPLMAHAALGKTISPAIAWPPAAAESPHGGGGLTSGRTKPDPAFRTEDAGQRKRIPGETLSGQNHAAAPQALAPVLSAFFTGRPLDA